MTRSNNGGQSRIALIARAVSDYVHNSLFITPLLFVIFGVGLAELLTSLDRNGVADSWFWLTELTADGARSLLAAIISATITVAGVVFALIALTVQLASSQYSPRVLRSFLRDRVQQFIMGYMAMVFTYSLLVLREVHGGSGVDEGQVYVPVLASGVAVVFAIGVVIAVLAAVNRTAHSLQIGELIKGIADETASAIKASDDPSSRDALAAPAPATSRSVHARQSGWIQQLSAEQVLFALPQGTQLWLSVAPGEFVHSGMRIGALATSVDVELSEIEELIDASMVTGDARTMQEDVGFGVRQLADIALRALSPGVNDPTTAQECIVHLRMLLFQFITTGPSASLLQDGDRKLTLLKVHNAQSMLELAFGELAVAARELPATVELLVLTLDGLHEDLIDAGAMAHDASIRSQRQKILACADRDLLIRYRGSEPT